MARYGGDFNSGRYTWRGRDQDRGYDFGYRGSDRWGDYSSGRGQDWDEFGGMSRGWGERARGFGEDLGESWDSMSGRRGFGEGYGLTGSMGNTGTGWGTGSTWRTGSRFDRDRGMGYSRQGMRPSYYDREMHGQHRMGGHDYDRDFGDRLRHGWNRIREGARGWMGGERGRYGGRYGEW